jgi:mRNA-degrading endonuclease RelE of RelBE toxin-antitoxin system
VEKADNLQDIPNVKKLKGYEEFYRIRVGRFRVGTK